MSKDDYKEENNKKETRQPEPYVYSSLEELFAAFGEPEQPVLHDITLQDLWPEKTEQSDKPVTYGLQDPADQPEQPDLTDEPEPEKPAPHGLAEPDEEPEHPEEPEQPEKPVTYGLAVPDEGSEEPEPVKKAEQGDEPEQAPPRVTRTVRHRNKAKRRKLAVILIIELLLLAAVAYLVVLRPWMQRNTVELALNGEPEITIEVGSEFSDPGVNVEKAVVSGTVDVSEAGDYTIEYTYRGQTVTRVVHVVDTKTLVVGLKGSAVQIVKQGDPYIENGAFAIDPAKGALDEDKITISGEVKTDTPGDYTVTYSAKSDNGGGEAQRTVRVVSDKDYGKKAGSVSVMFYNRVYDENYRPSKIDGNWIEMKALEQQLKYLSEHGYYYPGWKELRAWIDGKITLPQHSVILTFDGGKKDFLNNGLPLLEKYQIPATTFMTCWGKNDAANKIKNYASPYLDFESNSYAMHQGGNVNGYRGIIASMSKEEIAEDLAKAQKVIKNNDAFSFPYGDVTTDGLAAVQEQGFQCAFTTDYGRVYQGKNPMLLPRMRVLGTDSFESWRYMID